MDKGIEAKGLFAVLSNVVLPLEFNNLNLKRNLDECIREDDEEFSRGKRQCLGASIRLGKGSKTVLGRNGVKWRKDRGKISTTMLMGLVAALIQPPSSHETYGMKLLGFRISLDSEGVQGEYL
ncbi:hypothetical protein GOBAR_AA10226 [Gossypium barbadense]|uniref:Uncharacterized protein n=1 Tax=Gossypium barbadense TaxID=3634 RepID=A0A2P5Y4E3_GOSBA|nr:hypothetical protein GOBAR_AA10226 [Gossypium barbadense]